MQIEKINDELVIRVSSGIKPERLKELLNQIRYEELTAKSSATQKQVDELASNLNKSWWSKHKLDVLK